ncbi:MAG: hypothetical protein KAR16_11600 [Bacteroidales bacterium]|nr:hypothetical protein [Bacteroidales bacterium]
MKVTAPWIDENLFRFSSGPVVAGPEMQQSLPYIFEAISPIRGEGDDEVRQMWIRTKRGTIKDFGDFEEFREEGIIDTREEFEEEWRNQYPDPDKWYHIATARYEHQLFLYIDHKLALHYKPDPEKTHIQHADNKLIHFLSWLSEEIRREIAQITKDQLQYNRYLEQHLPYEKRTGKILRETFWSIVGDDTFRLDKELHPAVISDLEKLLVLNTEYDKVPGIPEISASGFLGYCQICYQANDYFRDEKVPLSPMEQYQRMADRRHGGLTEIDQESPEAFREWYHSGQKTGAHPWEICSGGNSTHISLMLSDRGQEWVLSLAGSSEIRVAETSRMASALYRNRVPFHLWEGKEILEMVRGKDYIGIVPDHAIPRYCHSLFPKKEGIIDFMNLPFEHRDEIITKSSWYPLEEVHVQNSI